MNVKTAIAGGLYLIRLSDSHYYGGRTANFAGRWQKHLRQLKKGNHPNSRMQAVFNQFGHFEPEVLSDDGSEEAEQAWLDAHVGQPGCVNIATQAEYPSRKGLTNSIDHRERISASLQGGKHSDEARRNMAAGQQRRFANGWSPELRASMMEARDTPEYRKKMSEAARKRNSGVALQDGAHA